jgi:hypothetical protein
MVQVTELKDTAAAYICGRLKDDLAQQAAA